MIHPPRQTALEKFAIAIYEGGYLKGNGEEIQQLLDEHKKKEKEQIVRAFDEGQEYEYQHHVNVGLKLYSETYYEKKYGGNK